MTIAVDWDDKHQTQQTKVIFTFHAISTFLSDSGTPLLHEK